MMGERLREIYALLYDRFGPQGWWPGDGAFEVIVGAILTQNTNWANVVKAISNLKAAGCMDVERLAAIRLEELAELIRPAGYYRVKARRLKSFLAWLSGAYGGLLENLEQISTGGLREELLSIKGIGPETADSILLYAFGRPQFVVDSYTARIAARHGLIEPPVDYERLQDLFESNLKPDATLFNEYHALLTRLGKEFCRPRPRCAGCPLEPLPHTVKTESF